MIEYKKDNSGVFSNFLRVIDWIWYHKYSKCPISINWNGYLDDILSLKNIENLNDNLSFSTSNWVESESYRLNSKSLVERRLSIPFYDDYSLRGVRGYFYTNPKIYTEKDFNILRNEFRGLYDNYIQFKDDFLNSEKSNIVDESKNVLGVHLRYSGHYCHNFHEGPRFINNDFYRENAEFVAKIFEKDKYEYIYVACDVEDFYYEIFKLVPKEKVLRLNYNRIIGDNDWSERPNIDMKLEVENVFYDFFNLSKTKYLLMSVSNVCFGVLTFNPELNYEFFPMLNNLHGM
jgi:hypothetical protein